MGGILRRQVIVFLAFGRVGLALFLVIMWLIGGFDNSGALLLVYTTAPLTVMFLSLALKYVGDHRYLPAGYSSGSGYDMVVKVITFAVCALQPFLILLQGFFFLFPSGIFFFIIFLLELATGAYAGYMLSDVFSDVVKGGASESDK